MVTSVNKRKEKDVMKLLVSEYEVQQVNENSTNEFIIKFHGPKESIYEGVSAAFLKIKSHSL
jgi:ubiquitin-conjugating enzyme E2 H